MPREAESLPPECFQAFSERHTWGTGGGENQTSMLSSYIHQLRKKSFVFRWGEKVCPNEAKLD